MHFARDAGSQAARAPRPTIRSRRDHPTRDHGNRPQPHQAAGAAAANQESRDETRQSLPEANRGQQQPRRSPSAGARSDAARNRRHSPTPSPEPRATSCKRMPRRRHHAYGCSKANEAAASLNGKPPTEGAGHETGSTRPVHMRSVAPELPTGVSYRPSPALRSQHRWTADGPNSEPTRTPDLEPQATSHEQISRQRHHAYGCPNDTDAVAAVNSQPPTEAGGKTRTTRRDRMR